MNCPPKVKKIAERDCMNCMKSRPSAMRGDSTSAALPLVANPAMTRAMTTMMLTMFIAHKKVVALRYLSCTMGTKTAAPIRDQIG